MSTVNESSILDDFKHECELTIGMSVEDRIRHGFTYENEPSPDNARWRSFDSMKEYRRWCDENLAKELGYGRSEDINQHLLDSQTALAARREIDRRKTLRLR
jgi:hypothetical protein